MLLFVFPNLLSLGAPMAEAATYYVAKPLDNGSNTHSCNQAQAEMTPKLTIAAGLACMSGEGHTLIIKNGTYEESINNTVPSGSSWSEPTTVRAQNARRAILRPTGSLKRAIQLRNRKFIIFDGLVVDGSQLPYGEGSGRIEAGNDSNVHHIIFRNGESRNAGSTAFVFGAGTSDIRILNNTIWTTRVTPNPDPEGGGAHGFYWRSVDGLIEGNEIHGWQGLGVQIFRKVGGVHGNILRNNYIYNTGKACLWIGSGDDNIAHHNVLANCGTHGIAVRGNRTKIYNNTIHTTGGNGLRINATKATIRNNILWKAGSADISGASGHILSHNRCTGHNSCVVTGDPRFEKPDAHKYQLRSGSPAINQGTSQICQSEDRRAGQCQSVLALIGCNGTCDIGRYEFGGVALPTQAQDLANEFLLNDNVTDSSGGGNHGSNTGVTFSTVRLEGSHSGQWDSTNDRIVIPTVGWSAEQGTIATWIQTPESFSGTRYIIGHTPTPAFANLIQLRINSTGQLSVGLGDDSTVGSNVYRLNLNTWYYVALRYGGGRWQLSIGADGSTLMQRASGTYTGLTQLASTATIGNNAGGQKGWKGRIDAFKVWNVQKSAADLLADCNLNGTCTGAET